MSTDAGFTFSHLLLIAFHIIIKLAIHSEKLFFAYDLHIK